MTVIDLIRQLQRFVDDGYGERIIVVDGYEGGVTEPQSPQYIDIAFNGLTGYSYYGEHDIRNDEGNFSCQCKEDSQIIKAVYLSRFSKEADE